MKTVTYTEIGWHELEQLVKEHLGVEDWSFVADVECGNDSQHTFEINWRNVIEQWKEYGESQWTRPNYYIARLIEMCVIPEGNVLVTVCW